MLFSFWSGPLSWVEHLCIASMRDTGHDLTLYSYEPLDVLPGVKVANASTIIPASQRFNGPIAQFADVFRYTALRHGSGIWVDLDMLMLRSLHDLGDLIFGLDNDKVSNAVLRLPPDCEALTNLLRFLSEPVIVPPWWPARRKFRQRLAAVFGLHKRPGRFEYSAFGPRLLTHFIKEAGLLEAAQPRDVFYPIHYRETGRLFDPSDRVESSFTPQTRAVHLYNLMLKGRKHEPPPPGSFLARMCEKHGVAPALVSRPEGRTSAALLT